MRALVLGFLLLGSCASSAPAEDAAAHADAARVFACLSADRSFCIDYVSGWDVTSASQVCAMVAGATFAEASCAGPMVAHCTFVTGANAGAPRMAILRFYTGTTSDAAMACSCGTSTDCRATLAAP